MNINNLVNRKKDAQSGEGRKQLENILSKMKVRTDEGDGMVIQFPTGHTLYDAKTSQIVPGINGSLILNYGMAPRLQALTGVSDVGKTTWAIQLGAATISRYPQSMFHFIDLEDNSDLARVQGLTHWDDDKINAQVQYSGGIRGMREVLDMLRGHVDYKKSNPNSLFNTGILDPKTGTEIKTYVPTVILLDSLAKLSDADDDDDIENMNVDKSGALKATDKLGSNVDGMRKALKLQKFVDRVKNYLSKYNIILVCIAHKTKEIQMGMFDVPDRSHALLKPGEKLKANKDFIYQCYRIIDMSAGKQLGPPIPGRPNREPTYGDSVSGIITHSKFIKNKSNINNTVYSAIHDAIRGTIDFLSDIEYLLTKDGADCWGVSGGPNGYILDIYPKGYNEETGDFSGKAIVWKRKTIYDMAMRDPLLLQAIKFTAFIHSMYSSALRPYYERGNLFPIKVDEILPVMSSLSKMMDLDMFVSMLFIFSDNYPCVDRVIDANRRVFTNVILPLYNSGYQKWLNYLPKEIIDSPVGTPVMPMSLIRLSQEIQVMDAKNNISSPLYSFNETSFKSIGTKETKFDHKDKYGELSFMKLD